VRGRSYRGILLSEANSDSVFMVEQKIGFFHKLSMYWDDEPPLMLSETDMLTGNYRNLSTEKMQIRIAEAMRRMFYKQDPGAEVRQSLGISFNLTQE
jgi:hypothetical protein